MFMKTCWN